MKKLIGFFLCTVILTVCSVSLTTAQNKRRIIQLSGFVSDSVNVLPGVHVYVPKAGPGYKYKSGRFFFNARVGRG